MNTKILCRAFTSLLLVGSLSCLSACRTMPLRTPNFQVQGKSQQQVGTAVKQALKKRKWAIIGQNPGRIQARYKRASHSATIGVDYNRTNVNIKLLKSENLKQGASDDGEQHIHKAYEKWISNLENDIYLELNHLNS